MTFLPLIQDPSQQKPLPDAALLLSDNNIDECLAMRITMDDPSNGCSLTYISQCFIRYVRTTGEPWVSKHYCCPGLALLEHNEYVLTYLIT